MYYVDTDSFRERALDVGRVLTTCPATTQPGQPPFACLPRSIPKTPETKRAVAEKDPGIKRRKEKKKLGRRIRLEKKLPLPRPSQQMLDLLLSSTFSLPI